MNLAVRTAARPTPAEIGDPLDPLAPALFEPLGVDGVYARTRVYEDIVERLDALISRHREAETEVLRFPPVMSRRDLERAGYLKSFPNLLGCVCALHGAEADIRGAADRHEAGGDWTASLSPADLVLTPAACYPLYPIAAARGPVPRQGLRFDVACDCFRHEPSRHLDRLQSFRMREYVCIGSPQQVSDFRERWIPRAKALADALGLAHRVAPASDPFFGRTGQVMAISQLQQSLKFELLIPLRSAERPTACMSFNCHRDHFGTIWGLRHATGEVAHTGCVAFGMDRLAVALFATHGLEPRKWPGSVRGTLEL
ncbi:MAG: amino acid--[acyl-carrier-protein] ligase [Methylobacteriaceae bacterium]|nr:amino acid--[acyl-carrier-protein] ligase [Methylobacteriaceae bacterium]